LGSNKEGSVLGEALYWMAEKLTWGYEDVEPDPVEALKLFRQSAELGFSDAIIRIGQLQQQGKGTARDPSAALKSYRAAAKAGNFVALGVPVRPAIPRLRARPIRSGRRRGRNLGWQSVALGPVDRQDPASWSEALPV
jgi:hypothetical protein